MALRRSLYGAWVEMEWVRNGNRKPGFFSLPVSNGRNFYPDFVAKLKDGRILIVEYKGKPFQNDDTREKENIGQLLGEKSQGQSLFLLATWSDAEGRHTQRQIDEKSYTLVMLK